MKKVEMLFRLRSQIPLAAFTAFLPGQVLAETGVDNPLTVAAKAIPAASALVAQAPRYQAQACLASLPRLQPSDVSLLCRASTPLTSPATVRPATDLQMLDQRASLMLVPEALGCPLTPPMQHSKAAKQERQAAFIGGQKGAGCLCKVCSPLWLMSQ